MNVGRDNAMHEILAYVIFTVNHAAAPTPGLPCSPAGKKAPYNLDTQRPGEIMRVPAQQGQVLRVRT